VLVGGRVVTPAVVMAYALPDGLLPGTPAPEVLVPPRALVLAELP
jgi:hypothetical protein